MKNKIYLLAFTVILLTACSSQKNSSGNSANFTYLIDQQHYTFVAQQVTPTEDARLNTRDLFPNSTNLYQLTSRYDLRITPDSVIAYLPFFGRSYTAPVNPSEGGIKFTSTNFSYKTSIRKKNYEIEISPKDNNEVRNLYLSISPSGYASLRISSLNKTPIGYNGIIEANR